jgi:hypothetical protein
MLPHYDEFFEQYRTANFVAIPNRRLLLLSVREGLI